MQAGCSGGDEQEGPHHSHGKQRGGYGTAQGVRGEEDGQGSGQGESAFLLLPPHRSRLLQRCQPRVSSER